MQQTRAVFHHHFIRFWPQMIEIEPESTLSTIKNHSKNSFLVFESRCNSNEGAQHHKKHTHINIFTEKKNTSRVESVEKLTHSTIITILYKILLYTCSAFRGTLVTDSYH